MVPFLETTNLMLPPPPRPINVSNCGFFFFYCGWGEGGRENGLPKKKKDLFEKKERDLHSLDFENRVFKISRFLP